MICRWIFLSISILSCFILQLHSCIRIIYSAPSDTAVKGVGCHNIRHLLPLLWFEDLQQSFTSVKLTDEQICTVEQQNRALFSYPGSGVMRFKLRAWLSNHNFISVRRLSLSCTLNAVAQSLCLCSNTLLLAQIFSTLTSKNSHAASNTGKIHRRIENQMLSGVDLKKH